MVTSGFISISLVMHKEQVIQKRVYIFSHDYAGSVKSIRHEGERLTNRSVHRPSGLGRSQHVPKLYKLVQT
jgi:hypothetical protein